MQTDPEAESDRRRVMDAARMLYVVPAYQGHWIGAVLFSASLVGGAMLYSDLPLALAVLGDAGVAGGTRATFLLLYAAMAVGPILGWILWAARRRWTALALMAPFAACTAWLSAAAGV